MPMNKAGLGFFSLVSSAIKILLLLLTFLLIVLFGLHTIVNYDIWWHLKTGEYIVMHGEIPHQDVFSYMLGGMPWINHEWLFQIFAYLVHILWGPALLVVGETLFTLMLFYILFLLMQNYASRDMDLSKTMILSFCLVLAALTSYERLFVRPGIVSLLFLVLYIYLLERYRIQPLRLFWFLPLLQVVWCNMHGAFILGPVVIGIFAVSDVVETGLRRLLEMFLDRDDLSSAEGEPKRPITFSLLCLLTVLSSLINPYGWRIFSRTMVEITSDIFRAGLVEWQPTFISQAPYDSTLFWYVVLVTLTLVSFLFTLTKIRVRFIFMIAVFLYLSLTVRRYIVLFAIVASPLLARNLDLIRIYLINFLINRRALLKVGRVVTCIAGFLSVSLVLYLCYGVLTNRYYLADKKKRTFGIGISEITYPIRATDFVVANDLQGNIFNDLRVGGYLIWRFAPGERKVFIDGRNIDESLFKYYMHLLRGGESWNAHVDRHGVNYVLLGHQSESVTPLIKQLYRDQSWHLVFFDEVAVLFVKDSPRNQSIIRKYSMGRNKPFPVSAPGSVPAKSRFGIMRFLPQPINMPYENFYRGNFLFQIAQYEPAVREYRNALSVAPHFADARSNLGVALVMQKRYQEAVKEFVIVLTTEPDHITALLNLGNCYFKLQQYRIAGNCWKKVLELDSEHSQARKNLELLAEGESPSESQEP